MRERNHDPSNTIQPARTHMFDDAYEAVGLAAAMHILNLDREVGDGAAIISA
jgi:hypothetical protein